MKIYKIEGYVNGINDLSDDNLKVLEEVMSNIDNDIILNMYEIDSVELDSFEDFEDSAFNRTRSAKEDLDNEFNKFKNNDAPDD
jgi:hypothetical protein